MENLHHFSQTIIVFILFVVACLLIDIVSHKSDKPITLKNATFFSIFWIGVSLVFGVYLYFAQGKDMAFLFFAGYALEKALSVDNLFVIMAIFKWFSIPEIYRHRVLYYGVLGAMFFRLVFVFMGTSLLAFSYFVEVVFALIIAYTAVLMLKKDNEKDDETDYSKHLAYKMVHRFFPVCSRLVGHDFFISAKVLKDKFGEVATKSGKYIATPLFLALCVIELSDLMFAFDSVPAVIAISREPLVVYSAMIFAVLGLRSLYFVLESLKEHLIYLEKAVIVLLFFISFKLLLNSTAHIFGYSFEISANVSLLVVLGVLSLGIFSSFFVKK